MKRAFTLLEIVFVLIILGILASIGSEIIAKVYENFLLSKSASTASYKLDVALLQIEKRLSYRAQGTEVARKDDGTLDTLSRPTSTAFHHIEWIGQAFEARLGDWNGTFYVPGWSGLADLNASTKSRLVTPGSKLSYAATIVNSVYGKNLNVTGNGCALLFRGIYEQDPLNAYGWNGSTPKAVFAVHALDDKTFAFENTADKNVSDIYYLVCSAYAIDHNVTTKKLTLYYDYRPWLGERYSDGKKVTLLENVTTFQIRKKIVNLYRPGGSIEIRICTEDNTSGTPVEFCGKKVVF
jgi:prepilin-type N-terminal cleavage/methylation domain-containing protein